MKISVITISFNQSRYLQQCIESVLNQDYFNFEYIIVDPGSTDGSREIIEKYRSNIDRVIFEPDSGPANGLNKAFSFASGDIYYFLNSDDYLLPNIFSRVIDSFKLHPSTDVMLYGGKIYFEDTLIYKNVYPSKPHAKGLVTGAMTFLQQGMFFRAQLFKAVGGFNEDNFSSWDGELLLDFILLQAKFQRQMERVAVFRIYSGSITGSQRFALSYEQDQLRMFNRVFGKEATLTQIKKYYWRLKKFILDPRYLLKKIFP